MRFCIGAATGEVVSRLCSTGLGRLHRSDAGGLRIVDLYGSTLGDTLEFVGTFCLSGHHFDVLAARAYRHLREVLVGLHHKASTLVAHDARLRGLTGHPRDVHGEVTHGFQAIDLSVLPSRGKCGEDLDDVVVALEQHLRDTRAHTEVTIDLEGSVRVVKVVIDTALSFVHAVSGGVTQGVVENHASMVAVLSACPEIRLPTHRPTGGHIAAEAERAHSCIVEASIAGLHLVEGEEAHQVTHVAVIGALSAGEVRILPLTEQEIALLDVALVGLLLPRRAVVGFGVETGVQIVEIIVEFCHIGRGQTEFCGTDCVDRVAANLQVGAHELLSVGHTVLRGTVFGRPLIGANPLAVLHTRVLLEAFHPEFS